MLNRDKIFIYCVIAIPVFNLLLDLMMNFFTALKAPAGIIRLVFDLGIIVYYLIFYGFPQTKLNVTLAFYIFYLFCVTLLASDVQESFIDGFLKIAISLLMIPLGIKLSEFRKNALIKPIIWTIIVLLINYAISQFYKVGVSVYEEDSFYKGGATASAPIIISLAILVIFNAFNKKMLPYSRIFNIIIVSIAIFIILLSVKRGAILALGTGILAYFLYTTKKIGTSIGLIIVGLFLLTIVIQNSELLETRINARTTERNDFSNENRFKETFYVIEEMSSYNFVNVMFGNEAFNSAVLLKKYFGRGRQLHVDYNLLILGTGIFGFFMYFFVHYQIWTYAKTLLGKCKSLDKKNKLINVKEDFALIVGCMILSLTMSFSGGLQFMSYRIILFLIIGYSIGNIKFQFLQLKQNEIRNRITV
ncbi:MAG: hypothetical protein EBQ94_04550 [Flavobacteriales bacterium]|nr:hypothetical protein [Crocinitomicaceae bacterium]NBX79640.1 hypothetical protein [Flavobacteriales bacterium]